MQYRYPAADDGVNPAAEAVEDAGEAVRDAQKAVADAVGGSEVVDDATGNAAVASASTDDSAIDSSTGDNWSFLQLHHTSVGISFGAVALFLVLLFLIWGCFQSRCCGIFNVCALCQPKEEPKTFQPPAAPEVAHAHSGPPIAHSVPALPHPYAAKGLTYNPYEELGPSSLSHASSAYGLHFGPPPPPALLHRDMRALTFEGEQAHRSPAPGTGRGSWPRKPSGPGKQQSQSRGRDRSPSSVSRIFMSARDQAARYYNDRYSDSYSGRFEDVGDEAADGH